MLLKRKIRILIDCAIDEANHGYCETSHDCDKEMQRLKDELLEGIMFFVVDDMEDKE